MISVVYPFCYQSCISLIKMAKSIFKSRVREYKGENIQKLQVNITKNLQCNCKIKDVEIKINYIISIRICTSVDVWYCSIIAVPSSDLVKWSKTIIDFKWHKAPLYSLQLLLALKTSLKILAAYKERIRHVFFLASIQRIFLECIWVLHE